MPPIENREGRVFQCGYSGVISVNNRGTLKYAPKPHLGSRYESMNQAKVFHSSFIKYSLEYEPHKGGIFISSFFIPALKSVLKNICSMSEIFTVHTLHHYIILSTVFSLKNTVMNCTVVHKRMCPYET